jgi:hypothetical protein
LEARILSISFQMEDEKDKYVSLLYVIIEWPRQFRIWTAFTKWLSVESGLDCHLLPRALELLISSLPNIDIHDMQQNSEYQGYRAMPMISGRTKVFFCETHRFRAKQIASISLLLIAIKIK